MNSNAFFTLPAWRQQCGDQCGFQAQHTARPGLLGWDHRQQGCNFPNEAGQRWRPWFTGYWYLPSMENWVLFSLQCSQISWPSNQIHFHTHRTLHELQVACRGGWAPSHWERGNCKGLFVPPLSWFFQGGGAAGAITCPQPMLCPTPGAPWPTTTGSAASHPHRSREKACLPHQL